VKQITPTTAPLFFFTLFFTFHWSFQKAWIIYLLINYIQIGFFNLISQLFFLFGLVFSILTNKASAEIFKLNSICAVKVMLDVIDFFISVFIFDLVAFAIPSMQLVSLIFPVLL
jgi:hypothetical protein